MSKILSQDEIDALLHRRRRGEPSGAAGDAESARGHRATTSAVPTASRRSRSARCTSCTIASRATSSTSLSAYLRTMTEVSIVSVEQFSYSEFLMSLPDPTAFYALSMPPFDGSARSRSTRRSPSRWSTACSAASARRPAPNRALTEIEQNVVDSVVKLMLENLTETWRPVVDMEFRIHGARDAAADAAGRRAERDRHPARVRSRRSATSRGMLNLCIPASVDRSHRRGVRAGLASHAPRADGRPSAPGCTTTSVAVPLPVTARSRRALKARELVQLNRGDVLSLGVPIQTPVTVRVGTPKFRGRLIAPGSRVGVLLESTASVDQSTDEAS